jgi:hypothetical protein
MAGSPKGQLSLDTNLPLDLAKALDFAHEFREECQQRGYVLRLPLTVLAELEYLILFGSEKNRRLAELASGKLGSWRLTPFDLPEVHHVVAERFARRLQHQRLIPEDEFHDGLILAETALAGIPLLVTSDKHLLDIDEDALLLACNEADLPPVRPVHPKGLLRALR